MMANLTDVTLTRTQKNAVLKLLIQGEFEPADFEWTDHALNEDTPMGIVQSTASTLVHCQTGYYFNFGRIYCNFVPGTRTKVEAKAHSNDAGTRATLFGQWLRRLREEVDAPDLWATIGQEKALSTAASSANLDNRPLNAREQALIAAKLDEIKAALLDGQEFATDQAAAVEREFAYLSESSERLGRKDWLNILLGGLFGLAVTLALDPEKAREIMRLAGTVFQSLWGGVQGVLR